MRRTLLGSQSVVGALGVFVIMGLGTAARAETAPATTASAATVESVVVTARRVAERLQDVPAAVTAVTARQIEEIKPRTIQDLSGLAPNVQIGLVGAGAGAAAIYIRGLGYSDIEKGQNPAVGLLIDDVVIGTNTAQLVDSLDVQQVEIGRGPQGIFYGKNTTAGAINVHRSRPTHTWGFNGSVAAGDHGQNIERFIANAPLGDQLGLKVGFSHRARDGFLNNIYTHNDHYGKDELNTGTVQLDWKPNAEFDALLSADFVNQTGEGTPVTLGDPAAAQVLGPVLAPLGIKFNEWGSPYIPGLTRPLNPREAANDYPDRNRLVQQRYSANLTWDSPWGQFVSITAFINQFDDAEQDFDGSCGVSQLSGPCPVMANPLLPFLHTSRPQDYTQFTEEARFTHDFGSRAKLLAGVFYYHHKITAVQFTRTAVPGVPVTASFTRQDSGESNDATSVFANLDYNVTDQLRVSAGFRYIDESKDFHNGFNLLYIPGVGPTDIPLLPQFKRSKSWSKTITRFSADYKLTENNLLYASVSDGFRSGGFSPRSTLSESIPGQTNFAPGSDFSGFQPETDTAYEIGSKNVFLDGQVTLNLAVFYTDDKDHQASEVVVTPGYGPGTNTYIVNLPKVEIKGAELEAVFRPQALPGLTLSALYGYQDAKIKNGRVPGVEGPLNANGTAGAPGSVLDLSGHPLERVPKTQYTLRGDYTWDVMGGVADVNVGYKWSGKYIFATFGTVPDVQKSYGLLDASASYAWQDGRYKITVSGKNLTDELYRSNSLPPVLFQGWSEPRTWLVEFQTRW